MQSKIPVFLVRIIRSTVALKNSGLTNEKDNNKEIV